MNQVNNKKGEFIFGDEAIVQGALEAGCGFASSYPGTPASEISDTFAKIALKEGVYFEYSTNEKVALEAAAGAAYSGVKSLVSMKHYGMNVALDSLLPLVYLECPLVVVTSDDPGSFSSIQTEEDTRYFSQMGLIPTFEPANPQEAKDMTKAAFEIAWEYKIPVLVRLTTRVAYGRAQVSIDDKPEIKNQGEFVKDKKGFKLSSGQTVKLHKNTLEKIAKIKIEKSETDQFNFSNNRSGQFGIVVSGVSYQYVKEILMEMDLDLPIFKIGMSYPFPDQRLRNFISKLKRVLVVEELNPLVENKLMAITKDINPKLRVYGKDLLPQIGEYGPEDIEIAISKILNKKISAPLAENMGCFDFSMVPERVPFWCPGCPHRATFTAVRKALGKDKFFMGDIGCIMMGAYDPYKMEDLVVNMGASIGLAHGISKTNTQKPVVFIGDSTFFHAGIPALINLVFNQSDVLVIILDNRYTAMTGQQSNPGTGVTATGQETKAILIEEIAKSCGADFVEAVSSYNLKELTDKIKELYNKKGVGVIVSKGECRLMTLRKMRDKKQKLPTFEIVKQVPQLKELDEFRCPAISEKNKKYVIDPNLCTGCSECKQIVPGAIEIKQSEEK